MNTVKKRLLFLTPQLPYPPVSGGVIKSWRLIEFLSQEYEVSLACFLKNDDQLHLDTLKNLVPLKEVWAETINVPRNPLNLIKSNLLGIPLNLFRNRSASFKKQTERMAANADIIFVDHYEIFQYVPDNFKGKVVLHQHNCEFLLWQRFGELETNPIKKLALYNQAFLIKHYEKKICKRSHTILAAPNDIDELVKIGADRKKFYVTYHLGDEHLLHEPALEWTHSHPTIMFVGTLTWEANIDGVLWFLKESWPSLKSQIPSLQFFIIGKNPDPRIIEEVAKHSDVILTGFVDDLEPYFKKSKVFVSPLRFGSGIKVKVMNALYRGIPTVTTPVGAEGLAVKHGEHMMVNQQPEAIVQDIKNLLEDEVLWKKLSYNSRTLAFQLYTWQAVLQECKKAIEEA